MKFYKTTLFFLLVLLFSCTGKKTTANDAVTEPVVEEKPVAQEKIQNDWATWRGPKADGISTETDWDAAAVANPASISWTMEAGSGYSGVGVWKSRVYTMGFSSLKDTVFCVDSASGKIIWQYSYDSQNGEYAGTRSTPVIHEGIVYTTSRAGKVTALDAETGTLIWQTDMGSIGSNRPTWGYACSAVIYKDTMILNAAQAGIALYLKDGSVAWKSAPGTPGYASAVYFPIAGKDTFLIFSQEGLFDVDAQTGKQNWFYPWKTDYDVNASDPLVIGTDRIFISSGYNTGSALLSVTSDSAKEIWKSKNMNTHYQTAFYVNDMIIGLDHPSDGRPTFIRALDPKTGEALWSQPAAVGAMLIAGNRIIFVAERGTVSVGEFSQVAYREVATGSIIKQLVWTAPVLVNGQLYVRNDKGILVCLKINK